MESIYINATILIINKTWAWRKGPMSPSFSGSQKEAIFQCQKHNKNCLEYRKPATEIIKWKSWFYISYNSVNINNCPWYAKINVYVHFMGATSHSPLLNNWPMKIIPLSSRVWDLLVSTMRAASGSLQSSLQLQLEGQALSCLPGLHQSPPAAESSSRPVPSPCTQALASGIHAGSKPSTCGWRMLASGGLVWSQSLSHRPPVLVNQLSGKEKELW